MPETLVLTTDLPYFPGRNGHDFFNLRALAESQPVGVVGPVQPFYPAEGLANLERFLAGSYFWPRPAPEEALPPLRFLGGKAAGWIRRRSEAWRRRWLLRLLGLEGQPADALEKLAVLANCAPQLLHALHQRRWRCAVLIQSSLTPWLDFLPSHLARLLYFHDVRSHFAARQAEVAGATNAAGQAVGEIRAQERRGVERADVTGYVSELDELRARELLGPLPEAGVAPIPVDLDYYVPAPAGFQRSGRKIVLFTGHLSHPPNVDAALWFLESVWPEVRRREPGAIFQAVGMHPAERLQAACAEAGEGVELHANVPDIRPYFWDASAYVVPMRFGGGVRQKIFEAWAMRLPVVSTTMGAEGVKAESGRNCWLADAPPEFAGRVADLLQGGPTDGLLDDATATVRAHNSIPAAAGRFGELVRRTLHVKRNRPYKVLLDLRWMTIGHAGGIEQMAYELVDGLARLDRRNEYRFFLPRRTYLEWDFPPTFRQRGLFTDKPSLRADALRAGVVNSLSASLGGPPLLTPEMRALRRYREMDFDVVHSLNGFIHPDFAPFPSVLTGIDLQHVHHPEFFTPEDCRIREDLYRRSSLAADHLIPISEFTRQDLHRTYGVPLERMTTVWIVPSRAAWLPVEPETATRALRGLGLTSGRYFFFPAHCWPHKNHVRLVEAFALAVSELPGDVQLVFTGRHFPADHPAELLRQDRGLQGRIRHLGYRTPLELRALYHGALGLVFPSLFEGFGMPVAEAMIAGCPVACANTTSLPEIAGDAAILFDPRDPADLARALVTLATDPARRAELVAAGLRRRSLFSARRSVVQTMAAYRRVFDGFFANVDFDALASQAGQAS